MVVHQHPEVIRRLLSTPGRWAVVGLSQKRSRPAYDVSGYLQNGLGQEIIPVHPRAEEVHGRRGYARLRDIPGHVDVVDIFVNAHQAGAVVDEAIAIGAGAVWRQLGVIDDPAAQRAADAGLDVVMDTCPSIEGPALGLG